MSTLMVRNEEPSTLAPGLTNVMGNSTTASTGGSSADDSASCSVMVMQLRACEREASHHMRMGRGEGGGRYELVN